MNIWVLLLLPCTINLIYTIVEWWNLALYRQQQWTLDCSRETIVILLIFVYPFCSCLIATRYDKKRAVVLEVSIAFDSNKMFIVSSLNICKINLATNKDSQRGNDVICIYKWGKTDMNIYFLNKQTTNNSQHRCGTRLYNWELYR